MTDAELIAHLDFDDGLDDNDRWFLHVLDVAYSMGFRVRIRNHNTKPEGEK
jgi:hypothetical protein